MLVRQFPIVTLCLLCAGCSWDLPPETFRGTAFDGYAEPVSSGYGFSSPEQVNDYLSSRGRLDSIEGIWRFGGTAPPQDLIYEVAIIQEEPLDVADPKFLGIVISSSNDRFKAGDLKFVFSPEDSDSEHEGTYYMGSGVPQSASFRVEDTDLIVTSVVSGGKWQELEFKRADMAVGNAAE